MIWLVTLLMLVGIPAMCALIYSAYDQGYEWMPRNKMRMFILILGMWWSLMIWVLITASLQHFI